MGKALARPGWVVECVKGELSKDKSGAFDEYMIDVTFASAKGGGDKIGPTKHGKGVIVVAIVDRACRSRSRRSPPIITRSRWCS
jgi:hypothetical protein